MSLLPEEQRALAGIEGSLRRSDPGLATMLATFTVTLSLRGGIPRRKGLPPKRSRIRRILPVALVAALAGFLLLALLLSKPGQPSQPACPPRHVGIGAFGPAGDCQLGGSPSRLSKSAAGDGPAAPPAPGAASIG